MFKTLSQRIFGKKFSNTTAKNRLQLVLVQDRSGWTAQDMDNFKRDLVNVISNYFVLERKQLDVEWERTDATTALIINTPIVGRHKTAKPVAA